MCEQPNLCAFRHLAVVNNTTYSEDYIGTRSIPSEHEVAQELLEMAAMDH